MACGFHGEWPETKDYALIPVNLGHGNFIDGEDTENQSGERRMERPRDASDLRKKLRAHGVG